MNEAPWFKSYPKWVPAAIDADAYKNIPEVFDEACKKFAALPAFTNMGHSISYAELDELSLRFASYLIQDCELKPGDRFAIQLPNVLQYPVALFGALRAGLIVVNTNPLYTEREMQHQYKDSGAKAIVILANFADKLENIIKNTAIKKVIITEVGDLLPAPKRLLINAVLKYVKRMVPAHRLQCTDFRSTLATPAPKELRLPTLQSSDVAFFQYTGGTTGVSKGAMLTHRNIIANMMQISVWITSQLEVGKEVLMTPLPLYHIFSLTVNCLTFAKIGANIVLVTNPRDIPGFIKELKRAKPTTMSVVNTLIVALLHHPGLKKLDLSRLKVTVAGGMALQTPVAQEWMKTTRTNIIEGYGLTETSPLASVNPLQGGKLGTIGLPAPSTEMRIIDEEGKVLPPGEAGELCVRGPQVMKGYWNQPEETAKVLAEDGWLKTGDIAVMAEDGYFKIVDRKKDMILVSGFNVYPNEIEEVAVTHPKVKESAAVGIADEKSTEVVKLFVVKKDASLTSQELISFCHRYLTSYKVPKQVEFIDELPKNNVGKILRRELRDRAKSKATQA
jgi:long-chain acyl-CoA synthetase